MGHNMALMKVLALAALLMLPMLAGCGVLPPGLLGEPVPGLTHVSLGADGSFKLNSGKEYRVISGEFSRPDGLSGKFSAEGVDAFAGQMIQAQTAAKQAELNTQFLNMILQIAVKAGLIAATGGAGALIPPGILSPAPAPPPSLLAPPR